MMPANGREITAISGKSIVTRLLYTPALLDYKSSQLSDITHALFIINREHLCPFNKHPNQQRSGQGYSAS